MCICKHIIASALLALLLAACANGKSSNEEGDKMSEIEQLKYDNALKKIESIYEQAAQVSASGNHNALVALRHEISSLKYDFNSTQMGSESQQKCQELKNRVEALKVNPESALQDATLKTGNSNQTVIQSSEGILISRKNLKLYASQRFPYSLNVGDKLLLALSCQGNVKASLYDIYRQKCIRQWQVSQPMTDSINISNDGIYMLELTPIEGEATIHLTLSYTGTSNTPRNRVSEKFVTCKKNEFLAQPSDSIIIKKVFEEPKRVGLRANLKSMFSGKSRVVIPVTVPQHSDVLLYSLRISTNEKTIPSDGEFDKQLSRTSYQMKLFGKNVFESHRGSGIIENLLINTRPPREEDAFCNMYVLSDEAQARRFQDNKEDDSFRYDVNQSQMGTQSCNGKLLPQKQKILYLGFENARMRYDNYIWLEIVALSQIKKYVRPVYMIR